MSNFTFTFQLGDMHGSRNFMTLHMAEAIAIAVMTGVDAITTDGEKWAVSPMRKYILQLKGVESLSSEETANEIQYQAFFSKLIF